MSATHRSPKGSATPASEENVKVAVGGGPRLGVRNAGAGRPGEIARKRNILLKESIAVNGYASVCTREMLHTCAYYWWDVAHCRVLVCVRV